MPADRIVLTVRASLAIQKRTNKGMGPISELLFDSFAQPLPPGARASVASSRQLLYRIGSVYVDMEIERTANSERAMLTGQMLDSARPGRPVAAVTVALHERGRNLARTLTNDNGEFRLQFEVKSDLKLQVSVDGRHPVYLPITHVDAESHATSLKKKRKANAAFGASSVT